MKIFKIETRQKQYWVFARSALQAKTILCVKTKVRFSHITSIKEMTKYYLDLDQKDGVTSTIDALKQNKTGIAMMQRSKMNIHQAMVHKDNFYNWIIT